MELLRNFNSEIEKRIKESNINYNSHYFSYKDINDNDNIRLTTSADVEVDLWGRTDGVIFTPSSAGYTYRRLATAPHPNTVWNSADWTVFDPQVYNNVGNYIYAVNLYEYSINGGTTWTVFGNNGGLLTNSFTSTPMVTLVMPPSASNKSGFVFRIVSIFNPTGTDYSAVGYAATTPANYSAAGAWRIDNFTVSNGALVLSTNQNQISGLQVYPNPTKNILNITTDLNSTKDVEIYDMIGKKVLVENIQSQLNVSSLVTGMYIVKITEDGKTSTKRLAIN